MVQERNKQKFRHRMDVQLRFNDVDRFGHVNNAVYFSLYDMAKTEYLHLSLPHEFEFQTVVPVVANINADFFMPVFYGDSIVLETAVVHIGTKSFTLLQQAVNTNTNVVVCQCKTVMVCFSQKEKTAVEIPDDVRKAFETYEGIEP
ncbi:MAG: thioesterase family protein [Bacteroidaceae bacterium]